MRSGWANYAEMTLFIARQTIRWRFILKFDFAEIFTGI
jgi:hypothetical protein